MSSNKVKTLRLARAWSQEQLAEMAALSVRTVQRIENGDHPSLETLSALAAVFGVSVTALSGQDEAGDDALDQRVQAAREKVEAEGKFWRSLLTGGIVCVFLFFLNRSTAPESIWSLWVAAMWGGLLLVKGLRLFVFDGWIAQWQKQRLQRLVRK
ncbi:helix-turn-helix domain-containing protein [Kosakonia sp. BK9b]